MLEALGWGLLAQSSLLVAGLVVCWVTVPTKVVGVLGGFGAGAMIAAGSFDLLPERTPCGIVARGEWRFATRPLRHAPQRPRGRGETKAGAMKGKDGCSRRPAGQMATSRSGRTPAERGSRPDRRPKWRRSL